MEFLAKDKPEKMGALSACRLNMLARSLGKEVT
jgi:hypothetical protein